MPGGSTLRCLVILLLLVLLPVASHAGDELTFCYEDKDSYPWVMTDHTGLNLELLSLVAAANQLQVRYVAVPWNRCLAGLARGHYDGAFASSFKAERLNMGRYPTDSDGRLDESKRLHTSVYALYRRRGSSVGWNGKEFRQLTSAIGSLSGFSISDFLRSHGATVDESSRDPLALLRMLNERRVDAVALQSLRADFVLQNHPALALDIEKAELPLEAKAYYLMLSNDFCQAQPEKAQRLWAEIERQRESSAYQNKIATFLAQPNL
jgi:polar amino acid transport system substrate-binding protein